MASFFEREKEREKKRDRKKKTKKYCVVAVSRIYIYLLVGRGSRERSEKLRKHCFVIKMESYK